MKHHIYVGMADHELALLQHGTRLYLVNAQHLSQDMFYQQVTGFSSEPCSACMSMLICVMLGVPMCCLMRCFRRISL